MTETRDLVHKLEKEARPDSAGVKGEGVGVPYPRGRGQERNGVGPRRLSGPPAASPSPPETCLPPCCRVRGPLLALARRFQDHG